MSFRTITTAAVLTAASLAVVTAATTTSAAASSTEPAGDDVVRVDGGLVRGQIDADHVTFSGIPYAAPPVGERRWAPPSPADPWTDVRDATTPAAACAQLGSDDDGAPVVTGSEDCLYLNVTAPRGAPSAAPRPVLVWSYGGGFVSGSGSDYDATRLATTGDLVVVTINYRLGALGFLSSPALDAPGHVSGNVALEDQAAALQWVQRNAAAFGGDPANVTLAGQSAGARAVCAHLASPASQGLFQRAIVQSGACVNEVVTKPVADDRGALATAEVGCAETADVAACLRSLPVDELLTTLPGGRTSVTGRISDDPWGPVAGTPFLPNQPGAAIADGSAADVPLLVGSTRNEMRPFVGFRYDAAGNPLTDVDYEAAIVDAFGDDAPAVLAEYPAADYPSPALALATVVGDWGGGIGSCPTLRTAEAAAGHAPVFAYEFAEDSGLEYEGFPLGAYHSWDLPFVWDVSTAVGQFPELTPEQERLGADIIGYWASFARTGDPNGPGTEPWPRFQPGGEVLGMSSTSIAPTPFAADHHCDFWATR